MKSYGVNAYRFSLSWSRIIPLGGRDDPECIPDGYALAVFVPGAFYLGCCCSVAVEEVRPEHDGSTADDAVRAYDFYREDVALMKSYGVNAYRFSLCIDLPAPGGYPNGRE
jgi:beta-glucosidase/6-phospho-beta-glucosidase/beta-galactosidase